MNSSTNTSPPASGTGSSRRTGTFAVDRVYPDARPYVRWWWFSGPIAHDTIRGDLEWIAAHGFGGVEIAWMYPQQGASPGPRWLSDEWSALAAYASRCARELGLGCDFTLGTAWPLGDSMVDEGSASRTFAGPSTQRVEKSWEAAQGLSGRVLNHLDRAALADYAARIASALAAARGGRTSAFFCDSWEVETEGLWTAGFGERFKERFGYGIEPFMPELDSHPARRYDYRKLLAECVLDEFYGPYAEICHAADMLARVQAHGAPTDLLAAYATADVPESEALLFEPHSSRLAYSAAMLAGRPLVSAEAFTCIYGWEPYPAFGPHLGEERVADLKLLADALVANGVNFFVWHGMPISTPGGQSRFYATTHVGPDCGFVGDLDAFNAYLTDVSSLMREGKPFAQVAVCLPLEDAWMSGELPLPEQTPGARYRWELRSLRYPDAVDGFGRCWVSAWWLRKAAAAQGKLQCGDMAFDLLYVDVEWLDRDALGEILRLAREGVHVCLPRRPRQPGADASRAYDRELDELLQLETVVDCVEGAATAPVLRGDSLPEYCCRELPDGTLRVFLANPATRGIRYPMRYGQGSEGSRQSVAVEFAWCGKTAAAEISFEPGQSRIVDIDPSGAVRQGAIEFCPA